MPVLKCQPSRCSRLKGAEHLETWEFEDLLIVSKCPAQSFTTEFQKNPLRRTLGTSVWHSTVTACWRLRCSTFETAHSSKQRLRSYYIAIRWVVTFFEETRNQRSLEWYWKISRHGTKQQLNGNAAKGSQCIGTLISTVLLFHCAPICDLELSNLVCVYPPLNLCPLLEIGRFLEHQKLIHRPIGSLVMKGHEDGYFELG